MRKCPQCGEKAQDWFAACPMCKHMFAQGPRQGALGSNPTSASRHVESTPGRGPGTGGAGVRAGKLGGVPLGGGKPNVDPFALAAFFAALFCGGVLGIPLGLLSLRRIRDSGGALGGRGLAIAGIVLGLVMFLFTVLIPVLVALSGA